MSGAAFAGAVVFAGTAGVGTFFAPCAFPLLPGYVGYYLGHSERADPGLAAAGAAAVGSLTALGVVAALTFALGRRLTALLPVFEPLVGVALVAFGAAVLVDRAPEFDVVLPRRPESVAGFGLFGGAYALAAAGCVVQLYLGVLSQALALSPLRGGVVLAVYAAGVAVPLVGVTLLAGAGVDSWRAAGRYTDRIRAVAAGVMVLAGLGQLYLSVVVLDVVAL